MSKCILNYIGCEGETAGVIGASGSRRPFCQNCADLEDSLYMGPILRAMRTQSLMDATLEALDPTPLITEVTQ